MLGPFIVLHFTLRSVIHFELILVKSIKGLCVDFFFFCLWVSSCSGTICWRDNLCSIVLPLLLCQRLVDCIYGGFMFVFNSLPLKLLLQNLEGTNRSRTLVCFKVATWGITGVLEKTSGGSRTIELFCMLEHRTTSLKDAWMIRNLVSWWDLEGRFDLRNHKLYLWYLFYYGFSALTYPFFFLLPSQPAPLPRELDQVVLISKSFPLLA